MRVFFLYLSLPGLLIAAPEGFHLIKGEAKPPLSDTKGCTTIETGRTAIVEWDSFSIGSQETVRFLQPDSRSAILNRVVGFSESRIDGALLSNGQVLLVNKNGVLIGPNGRIETAGFIGSTFDLLNEEFIEGKALTFKGETEKPILNLGKIEAADGDIFLIGSKISNSGDLKAANGHVGIACGQEILIQPEGDNRIFIKVPLQNSMNEEFPLEHSGTIQALKIELKAGTRPYEKAIKFSGKAEALSTIEEGGHIYLVAGDGLNEFSGEIRAKEAHLLGDGVFLEKGLISVSQENGGGTVLIGGDYKGSNPEIPNARLTYINKEAKIEADALKKGDGGKVIAWGNEATAFFGNISAKGGPEGGNGGFIEVSGASLKFDGIANTSAPLGKAGLLYLDPVDVLINGGPDMNVIPGMFYGYPGGCASPANINIMTLEGLLAVGNVTIDSNFPAANLCAFSGQIIVNGTITWLNTNMLNLTSISTITFLPGTSISGGALFLNASDLSIMNSTITMTQNCNMIAANTISLTGSNFDTPIFSAFCNPGTGTITTSGANFSGSGNVTFSAPGNISITTAQIPFGGGMTPALVEFTSSSGEVSINGSNLASSEIHVTAATGATVSLSPLNCSGNFVVNLTTGDLNILDSPVQTVASCNLNTIPGNLVVSDTIAGTSSLDAGLDVTATVNGNVQVLSTAGMTFIRTTSGNVNLTVGGNLSVQTTTGPSASIETGGAMTLNVTGDVNVNAALGTARIGSNSSSGLPLAINANSINLTSNNGATSRIDHQSGIPFTPNSLTLISMNNIALTTTTAADVCLIGNVGAANSGNVTLVCDNASPSSLGSGAILLTGPGSNQLVNSTGDRLSIYSVSPSQNSFPSSINGAAFPPLPLGVDNNYQQFSIFYPAGTYIGPEYMLFYKTPATPSSNLPIINSIATTVLQNILTPADSNTTTSEKNTETEGEKQLTDQAQHTPYNNDNRGGGICH